jgi:hypothetical protein
MVRGDDIAVQVEQGVELPERQVAVPVEEGDGDGSEAVATEGTGVGHHRREQRLVGPVWATVPAVFGDGPERVVDDERSSDERPASPDPVERLGVEGIEGIDEILALVVEAVTVEVVEPCRPAGAGVRILVAVAG